MNADVTRLLQESAHGDEDAHRELLGAVYEQLRQLSEQALRHERHGHTLQPTALAHEAYLRLIRQDASGARNRGQFFAIASLLIRRILVDHAREKKALKRGAGAPVEEIRETLLPLQNGTTVDVLALDEALQRLEAEDPAAARVVEMRFFCGQSHDEIAEAFGVSRRTVLRQWAFARAFLFRELNQESDP